MNPALRTAIVLAFAATLACDEQTSTSTRAAGPATTAPPESEPKSQPSSSPASKPQHWTFDGAPGARPPNVEANREIELDLQAECTRGAGAVGSHIVGPSQPLEWEQARTVVTEPREVVAREELTVTVAPMARNRKAADAAIDLAVPKGGAVGLLKDAGNDRCYVVIESMIGLADCPTPERFEAEGWTGEREAADYFWCVQPKGVDGWLRVDPRYFDVSSP